MKLFGHLQGELQRPSSTGHPCRGTAGHRHHRHVLVAICSAGPATPGVTSAPLQGSQQQLQEQQQAASSSHAAVNAAPISSCSCSHDTQHGRPHPVSSQESQPTAWRHAPQQPHHQHVSRQRDSRQQRHRQPLQPQLQLLSDGPGKGSSSQRKPEPPTTSGAPPPDAAGSGSNAGNSGSSGSNGSSGSSQPATGSNSVDDEVDQALEKVWASLKRDLKKELPPEQASMLDSWSPSDIQTDKVFREMANHQLGPFLQSMGINEDPYEFFLDLFRLSLVFQLAAAGLVFYTVELGLGGDVGDAFRAVGGLLLGYTLRLGIKVEQLAWPIYNGLVQLLISEGATYEIPPASAEEQRDTLNRLGIALAAAFLLPKLAFGWQNDECWQLVVPMLGGLFFFDVAYMFGLLIKLGMSSGSSDDDRS